MPFSAWDPPLLSKPPPLKSHPLGDRYCELVPFQPDYYDLSDLVALQNDIKFASVSTSLAAYCWKCRSAIPANTLCISATSARIGVLVNSSSNKRSEFRRRLGSLGSLRGRLAGVTGTAGLDDLDIGRCGFSNDTGGGGSLAVNGDGYTGGIRSKCNK
jgi:hypothetical protein